MQLSLEAFADRLRPYVLSAVKVAGRLRRFVSQGWGLVAWWLLLTALALRLVPPIVDAVLAWAGLEDPRVGDVWSVWSVLGVCAALLLVRWLAQARGRVVVEEFVDYTRHDATAVKGLATLLIAELSRLQNLYSRVQDELSVPTSVGVTGRGGTGPGTEPGDFLSVSADQVGDTLKQAVATEMSVSFGGFKVPIGWVMSLVGRLARGPRVLGSLHFTDAAGGPTLTAQIVGRGQTQQWRVDAPQADADARHGKAFLDDMVAELAYRMFSDLTLQGSVRWSAVRPFTEHLDHYWESHRKPRDRAIKLEAAAGKLLEAIAEDEKFDRAFYNLGVIYSQLADTEQAVAENSDYIKTGDDPDSACQARRDAALVAFNRAVELNRERPEAVYALAVHEYAGVIHDPKAFAARTPDPRTLQAIICRCERVIELDRSHAQAYELMGRAQLALAGAGRVSEAESERLRRAGERSLRAAVDRSWRRLWAVEYDQQKSRKGGDSLVSGAKANLAAALRALADATYEHAGGRRRWLKRADRLFIQAAALGTGDTRAATLLAHGATLEERDAAAAWERYHEALKIDPENSVYWAHLAVASALRQDPDVQTFIKGTYNELSPIYRRTIERHSSPRLVRMRDRTLEALARTYAALRDSDGIARVEELRALPDQLERAIDEPDATMLSNLKDRFAEGRAWEREQVQIVLARKLGRLGQWSAAAREYRELIDRLADERPDGVVQHSLRAKHARALRKLGERQRNPKRYEEALEVAAAGLLQNPLSACARREVGKAHFALLQFDEALEAWQQTLWLTPNDPMLHWKVAFCHWNIAQDLHDKTARRRALTRAAEGFHQAALLFGAGLVEGWAWSQLWAGRVHQELGELDAAIGHLRAAASCTPTKRPAQLLLGEAYQGVGDHAASRVQLQSVAAALRSSHGRMLDKDWGETLTDHEAFVRARVALGRLELDAEHNAREARRYATEARVVIDRIVARGVQARCEARVAELEWLAVGNGASRNGRAPVKA